MDEFRDLLRRLLRERGWSLPQLATRTGYNRSYLWEVQTGRKTPSADVIRDVDDALDAAGRLIAAGGEDVQRRDLLRDAGALAALTPLAWTESVRQDLGAALGHGRTEQWEEIAADYARDYYRTPPRDLLNHLMADFPVLQRQMSAEGRGGQRTLARCAGVLSVITAMTWANLGEARQARRWWRSARQAADAAGDVAAQVWVRGWEVSNGTYEGRSTDQIYAVADHAVTLASQRADAGTAGLYAGIAQTAAVAGDAARAGSALLQVIDLTERMDAATLADSNSMFGWPEVRLRHTESYVLTFLGRTGEARVAQDRALDLYGQGLPRERAAVELHRARCLITEGHVSDGARDAVRVVDDAAEYGGGIVQAMATETLRAVPESNAAVAPVRELRDRLTHSEITAI